MKFGPNSLASEHILKNFLCSMGWPWPNAPLATPLNIGGDRGDNIGGEMSGLGGDNSSMRGAMNGVF